MTKKDDRIAAAKERDNAIKSAAAEFEFGDEEMAQLLANAPALGTYSAANLQLLVSQAFEREMVISDVRAKSKWNALGRAIQGPGLRVMAPCKPSKKQIEAAKADGYSDAEARKLRGFTMVSVWDVSQTVPGKEVTSARGFKIVVPDPEGDPRVGLDRAEPTEAEKDVYALRKAELIERGYTVEEHAGEYTLASAVVVDHEARTVEVDTEAADGAILAGLVMACRDVPRPKRATAPAPRAEAEPAKAAPQPVRLAI